MGRLTHRTAPRVIYFVTTKTWGNRNTFLVTELSKIVSKRISQYRDQGAYLLHEFVVMPNHLHLLITPGETSSLEKAMQLIKGGSSYEIHRVHGSKTAIWQSGFYDWTIRNAEEYAAKSQYIRMNPVEARLVLRAEEWEFGSASDAYRLDPAPESLQGLKPLKPGAKNVGAKAPTP